MASTSQTNPQRAICVTLTCTVCTATSQLHLQTIVPPTPLPLHPHHHPLRSIPRNRAPQVREKVLTMPHEHLPIRIQPSLQTLVHHPLHILQITHQRHRLHRRLIVREQVESTRVVHEIEGRASRSGLRGAVGDGVREPGLRVEVGEENDAVARRDGEGGRHVAFQAGAGAGGEDEGRGQGEEEEGEEGDGDGDVHWLR